MNIKHADNFSDEVDVENGNDNVNLVDLNDVNDIDDDDECVVEECDEDSDDDSVTQRVSMKKMFDDSDEEKYNIHDQLPSVEEVKASQSYLNSAHFVQKAHRNKLYLMIAAAAFAAMALSVGITIGIFKSSNKEQPIVQIDMNAEMGDRVESIVQFLFESGISSLPDMRTQSSPQYRAILFMAAGDGFHSNMKDGNLIERARFVERYILALLYYQMGGDQWTNRYDWLSTKNHCEWHKKASGTVTRGVSCNDDKLVTQIDLSHNNLVNHIPLEIKHIIYLEKFHVYENIIGGTISQLNLKQMKHLKSLGLARTHIGGSIPSWLGQLTGLTTLSLGDTKLTGTTIPENFAELTNLRLLGLEGLGLTGNFDPILKLSKLEALYLEDNFLSGSIYNSEWTAMKEIDLSNNMIWARLPDSLITNKNLRIVDLHHNKIFGNFPDDIINNDNLQYFDIRDNDITGTITDRIGYLDKLQHFDISHNGLEGTLPDTIQLLTNLVSLRTSGNNFDPQPMMDFFKQMKNLKELGLKDNNFSGTLPRYFVNLVDLQSLDLEGNNLSGTISTFYGTMSKLNVLKLNNNKLTGTIPSQLSNLNDLKILLLNGNSLQGTTEKVCEAKNQRLVQFTADCYPSFNNDSGPEVECNCCSLCCNDEEPECNEKVSGDFIRNWSATHDSSHGDIYSAYTTVLEPGAWQDTAVEKAMEEAIASF